MKKPVKFSRKVRENLQLHSDLGNSNAALRMLTETKVGAADGLNGRQCAIVQTVGQLGSVSQTKIVEETGIDRATLGKMIPIMIREGYLQRRRSRSDRRAYAIKLTQKGRRVFDHLERNDI